MITAKKINKALDLKAAHCMYDKNGKWFHHLRAFPGILFDRNGYLTFQNETDYLNHNKLKHTQDLHVDGGIDTAKEYVQFSTEEKNKIFLF